MGTYFIFITYLFIHKLLINKTKIVSKWLQYYLFIIMIITKVKTIKTYFWNYLSQTSPLVMIESFLYIIVTTGGIWDFIFPSLCRQRERSQWQRLGITGCKPLNKMLLVNR